MTTKTLRQPTRVLLYLTVKARETKCSGPAGMYAIMLQHDGWIEAASEREREDSLEFDLANTDPTADDNETPAVQTSPVRRQATILVVEDQPAIRMLAEDVLTEAGHTVLTAPNGQVALEMAAQYEGEIDLVVTDVVMPELNGPELVSELSRSRPSTRVLYISGFVGNVMDPAAVQDGHSAFLKKPFLPAALAEKVRSLLGPCPAGPEK